MDESTKLKPEPGKTDVQEIAIAWMKNSARAAGELYLEGATKKIILTGGKTGGAEYKSEAELMRDILVNEYRVPESDIILEDKATNTLQNIPLSLNKIDSGVSPDSPKPKVGLLGADFHLSRIRLLAQFFGVENNKAFSAEQIFNLIAEKTDDINMKQQIHLLLSTNEDLSAPNSRINWPDMTGESKSALKEPTLFEKQVGSEKKGIIDKMLDENWFTYGLIKEPKYWIGYLGYLQNNDRLLSILNTIDKSTPGLFNELNINIQEEPEKIKEQLLKYTKTDNKKPSENRVMPPTFNEGRNSRWPNETSKDSIRSKLEKLVNHE